MQTVQKCEKIHYSTYMAKVIIDSKNKKYNSRRANFNDDNVGKQRRIKTIVING